MPCLNSDWLDALAVVRRHVQQWELTSIFNSVDSIEFTLDFPVHLWEGSSNDPVVKMPSRFPSLYKIERVEAMIRLAISRVPELGIMNRRRLCDLTGCAISQTPDIRERWRLIDYSTPAHLLPYGNLEDRPICKMCKQPVATDSGAWIKQNFKFGQQPAASVIADIHELEAWRKLSDNEQFDRAVQLSEAFQYKSDVHEECMRYAHRILMPALQEQREREAAKATAEVDK